VIEVDEVSFDETKSSPVCISTLSADTDPVLTPQPPGLSLERVVPYNLN
jgi:hypothetical protein